MLCAKPIRRVQPKTFASLQKLDKMIFLNSFDYVILGLDGYYMNFLEDYEGLDCVLYYLQNYCKKVCCATNDTLRTSMEHLEFFVNRGLSEMEEIDIMSPVKAILHYCKHNVKDDILSLCCEEVNRQLMDNGLQIVTPITERQGNLEEIREFFTPDFVPGAILIDINFNLHISHLTCAVECLKRFPNCKILITQTKKMIPLRKDCEVISPFGFINSLKKCSKKEPVLLGKPGAYFQCLMKYCFKVGKPCRTLFIGENLETDIQFGIDCGFQTVLLTDSDEMIESLLLSPISPNFCIKSLTEFAEFLSTCKNIKQS